MSEFKGGWKLDSDNWLWRPTRPMDGPLLVSYPDAGFTTPQRTYVRSLGVAEALDRGEPAKESYVYDRHGSEIGRGA